MLTTGVEMDNMNISVDQDSKLLSAVRSEDAKGVREAIENGANIEARNDANNTALHLASMIGNRDICLFLIKHNANICSQNKWNTTPLHYSARHNHISTSKVLIENGADLTAVGNLGLTPLHTSCRWRNIDICRLLIHHGASLSTTDMVSNQTPLHIASKMGEVNICKFFIEAGADLSAVDKYGNTALHLSIRNRRPVVCQLLVQGNSSMCAKNKDGLTPLKLAEEVGNQRVIDYLKYQSNLKELALWNGTTPLSTVKLVCLGDPGSGKSTLMSVLQRSRWSLQRLREVGLKPSRNRLATPGIRYFTLDIPGDGRYVGLDCAGQAEFQATHSSFLGTRNAIFLVLYNITLSLQEQQNQLKHWLAMIKAGQKESFNSEPDGISTSVIVVATHYDLVEDKKQAITVAKSLLTEMKNLFKTLNISNEVIHIATHKSWTKRTRDLRDAISNTGKCTRGTKVIPSICMKIEEHIDGWLEELHDKPMLTFQAFRKKVEAIKSIDINLTSSLLRKAAQFMSDTGVIYLAELVGEDKDDIIILNPSWLSYDVFGKLFATETSTNYDGIVSNVERKPTFTRQEIIDISNGIADPGHLISLLQQQNLIYRYDDDIFVIPGLLPLCDSTESTWIPDKRAIYYGRHIKCVDESDMLSPGFFPCLIVKILKRLNAKENQTLRITQRSLQVVDGFVEAILSLSHDLTSLIIATKVDDEQYKESSHCVLMSILQDVYDIKYRISDGTVTEERIVSSCDMKTQSNIQECTSYSLQDLMESDDDKGFVFNEKKWKNDHVTTLLCQGYDVTCLKEKGYACDIQWLLASTVHKLEVLLGVRNPLGRDFRMLADEAGVLTSDEIYYLDMNSTNEPRLKIILNRWSDMADNDSTIQTLCTTLQKMSRPDACNIIIEMMEYVGIQRDEFLYCQKISSDLK